MSCRPICCPNSTASERPDELCPFHRIALLLHQPNRLDQTPAVERRPLSGRRRILRRGGWRSRHRASQPLERQLAIEQFGISPSALKVSVGLLKLAGGKRRPAGP